MSAGNNIIGGAADFNSTGVLDLNHYLSGTLGTQGGRTTNNPLGGGNSSTKDEEH